MKRQLKVGLTVCAMVFAGAIAVQAHTPLCSCYDNGDGTVTCEGGFSDGSSASGVPMKVSDASGKVVEEGQLSDASEYTFKKPEGDYTVLFDGGEGHKITISSKDIAE
ncbi:MAG: hypothetical protein CSA20_02195 [Deltaproteobacteria bacterium]|nr:MAG: hypothetical protein CSA20_02195 [Deltaproteobacteria bacterium]